MTVLLLLACLGRATTDSPLPEETVENEDSAQDSPVDTNTDTGREDSDPSPPPRQVYLLGGQSNMDGWGYVTGLPPALQLAQDDVDIYWSGRGQWTGLAASASGSAWGVEYFGPEVLFGRTLADRLPEQQLSLVKHAVGGTDLAECWNPGESREDPAQGGCYQGFIQTVDAALAELDAQGVAYEVAGMAWMQGESDAYNLDFSDAYGENLAHLIARVREDVSTPEMPFVMGQIDCIGCPYRDTVRDAQAQAAAASESVFMVATDDLPQNLDFLHFDASGQRTLGRRMAEALLGDAAQVPTPQPAFMMTGAGQSRYTGDYVVGYAFELEAPVLITDLGTLDLGGDGLSVGSSIAIWDAESQAVLARATVPAQVSAPSSVWGGWRFVAIDPLRLDAGHYVIGSQVYNGSPDRYLHDTPAQAAAGVVWEEGRHSNGTGLLYPSNVSPNAGTWFGPNFLFRAVDD